MTPGPDTPSAATNVGASGATPNEPGASVEASSAATSWQLAEDLRRIAESIVDTRTEEGKRLLEAASLIERLQSDVNRLDAFRKAVLVSGR